MSLLLLRRRTLLDRLRAQGYLVSLWKANTYSGSGSLLDLSGKAHDMAFPGGTNDPLWLPNTGTRYIYSPGSASNDLSVPDSAAVSITGDIDIRIEAALDSWTVGNHDLLTKWTTGQKSFGVVMVGGTIRLYWSNDGTANLLADATVVIPFAARERGWVRATLDVDNGAAGRTVTFYTSTDGTSWTQLGAPVTTAGVTSIFDGAAAVYTGQAAIAAYALGKIYRTQLRNGIGGTLVLDVDTSQADPATTTFTEQSSNAATVTLNRSATGRKLAVVDRPLFLFGTDDYLSASGHADFSFTTGEPFTLAVVSRSYGASLNHVLLTAETKYRFKRGATPNDRRVRFTTPGILDYDSAADVFVDGQADAVSVVFDASADVTVYRNGASQGTIAGTAWPSAGTPVLAIGKLQTGDAYADMEFIAACVIRRALTAAEIARLSTELVA